MDSPALAQEVAIVGASNSAASGLEKNHDAAVSAAEVHVSCTRCYYAFANVPKTASSLKRSESRGLPKACGNGAPSLRCLPGYNTRGAGVQPERHLHGRREPRKSSPRNWARSGQDSTQRLLPCLH